MLAMGTDSAAKEVATEVLGTSVTTKGGVSTLLKRGAAWPDVDLESLLTVRSDLTIGWDATSLPPGSRVLYSDHDAVGAAVIPMMRGEVVLLAADFDALPSSPVTFAELMPKLKGALR